MDTPIIAINLLNDRILATRAQLELLHSLRAELLNASAASDVTYVTAPGALPETAAPAVPPAPLPPAAAPVQAPAKPRAVRPAAPAKPARESGKAWKAEGRAVAERVRQWIEAQEGEFSTSSVARACGGSHGSENYRGVTCALGALRRRGWIASVRRGWWARTPAWPAAGQPTPKEKEYRKFREALQIKVPEIEGAAPASR